jgi:nitronate monooxygenase
MVVGLINDIPTCEELISRIVREAREIVARRLAPAMNS